MPKLILHLPDGTEAVHELTEDVIGIGRLPDNAIQVDDPSVSSHHAELTLSGADYFLRDLDSTNGTRVNGQAFTEGALRAGDRVRLGKIDCIYASEDESEGAKPLPEHEHHALEVAASSARPTDFANASPFKKKMKKKEPAALGILVFTGVAVAAFVGAVVLIFMLQPPL